MEKKLPIANDFFEIAFLKLKPGPQIDPGVEFIFANKLGKGGRYSSIYGILDHLKI